MVEDTSVRLVWAVTAGVLGLAVGSFVNVVAWRLPRRESLVAPASRCPACLTPIRPLDNVPVVSWLALRGRCRSCGVAISARYPLVELVTGAVGGSLGWRFAGEWEVGAFFVLGAGLVAIAVIDLEHYLVPNRLLGPLTALCAVLFVGAAVADARGGDLARSALGGAAAFVALLAVHLVSPRGMGMGDVKLAFLLGVSLGWLSWRHVALGLFLGFLDGAVVGVILVVTGTRRRDQAVPFAPFLAAGTLTAVLVGAPILDWYSGL